MTQVNTVEALEAPAAGTPTDDTPIRPFRAEVSDGALADLRRRIEATRWPDKETVAGLAAWLPDHNDGQPAAAVPSTLAAEVRAAFRSLR